MIIELELAFTSNESPPDRKFSNLIVREIKKTLKAFVSMVFFFRDMIEVNLSKFYKDTRLD
jgi:hypothetical protein